MNFISSGKQYFTHLLRTVVKYRFLPREASGNVIFFLLYRQKDIHKIIEANYRNYVIDKLMCEIMENKPLGSRM